MTRDEIMNSVALKKRFCWDCNLPIAVFDNPYFSERLKILDIMNDCISKFDVFCKEVQNFTDEYEYFKYYNMIKNALISFIKRTPEYKDFINSIHVCASVYKNRSLYIKQNDGCSFISIKMKKANFSAMRYYSDKIFDGCKTWELFVSRFTNSNHIKNSNYMRQIVLSCCRPDKQLEYERYLITILCNHIIKCLPVVSIYSLSDDEIIIEIPNCGAGFSMKKLRDVVNNCSSNIGTLVEVDSFELTRFNDGWAKIYNDESGRVDFKFVDKDIYHQIVKYYFGDPITNDDLVFCHNGKLARFVSEVNNPWEIKNY